GKGYALFLTPTETVLSLNKGDPREAPTLSGLEGPAISEPPGKRAVLRLRFAGASEAPSLTGEDELPGKVSHFRGNDPARWRTGLSTYRKVRYHALYPGIDLVFYGNQRQLEYDLVVSPGADPSAIRLAFDGADRISLDDDSGNLNLEIDGETVLLRAPYIYQERDNRRQEVPGQFTLLGPNEVGFRVGDYDHTAALVLDPVLQYSTYLGGSENDMPARIVVDSTGAAYIIGSTDSFDFPTAGAIDSQKNGSSAAFVSKLSPDGTSLIYSTYLDSGSAGHNAYGVDIAVDSSGAAYITGYTDSSSFPTVSPIKAQCDGLYDAIVAKIDPSGTALVYSTLLGGNGQEKGIAIAVDSSGAAYVTGWTDSNDFQTVNPIQGAKAGLTDLFVSKINASGTALVYSTYLGGDGDESSYGIAVDSSGAAYLTGNTGSSNFPTVNPIQGSFGGGSWDVFISKINSAGSALDYSTYLGGDGAEQGMDIAIDGNGSAYITGGFGTRGFATAGAFDSGSDVLHNIFIAKLSPTGQSKDYFTYLGGSGNSQCSYAIAVDASGSACVAGDTNSTDFPTTTPLLRGYSDRQDAFVTKINTNGTDMVFSTYLGGQEYDYGKGIALDSGGAIYVAGKTYSTDFPTYSAFSSTNSGEYDGFITKIIPYAPRQVPDTGQSASFTDTIGEDSDYRINTPSYTKLDASGNDLPDNAVSWSMVRDNITGLVWEVKTDDGGIHDRDNTYGKVDASNIFITQLNSDDFGGYSDWRLPGVRELSSLVHSGVTNPAIDTGFFPNTQFSTNYWSNETLNNNNPLAWSIHFGTGAVAALDKGSALYVRAVRGSRFVSSLKDNGDGTVTDINSGLMWQQVSISARAWENALSYCENLALGGYEDWRLPTWKELQSIVDLGRSAPAIDGIFTNTESGNYWSSTSCTGDTNKWTLNFEYGYVEKKDPTLSLFVRAVRGGAYITQASPFFSHLAGGAQVTISGNGFGASLGGGRVWFGDTEATSIISWQENQIVCLTPAHAEGVVDVRVTCQDGHTQAALPLSFIYTDGYSLTVNKTGGGAGTVSSDPAGIDCGADCEQKYDPATQITLSATPGMGSSFTGWSGGGCSGTGDCTVSMDQAKTVTAEFTLNQYNLTVSETGNGSGTVTSDPAGIACGADCGQSYDYGTSVALNATADPSSIFTGWSGGGCSGTGGCTVTVDQAKSVSADFTLKQYTLSGYVRDGYGNGLAGVVLNGLPGDPSTDADGFYSATVNYGWGGTVTPSKVGWNFEPVSTDYANVTEDGTRDYTATKKAYTITATAFSGGTISPSGTLTVEHGTDATFTITPNIGYKIAGLTTDTGPVPVSSTYTFTNVTANRYIQASFEQICTPAYTTLSINLSSQTILFNGTVTVAGKLSCWPDDGQDLSGKTITLTVTRPDNSTWTLAGTTSDEYGHYEFAGVTGFGTEGLYSLRVGFHDAGDPACFYDCHSDDAALRVGKQAGYAILVQGKVSLNEGYQAHVKTTDRIYRRLKDRGFIDDNIKYFCYEPSHGDVVVDAAPTRAGIQEAVETWAPGLINGSPAPLYLIMVDHGNRNAFYINNEVITPADLNAWLTNMENTKLNATALQENRIVVIGACYSGTFLPVLSKNNGRVIVTSSAGDEESYKGPKEPPDDVPSGEFFMDEFFQQLWRGESLRNAFATATDKTEIFTRRGGASANTANPYFDQAVQHPLLDDNGDGIGTNALSGGVGDGVNCETVFLGTGLNFATNPAPPADITDWERAVFLGPGSSSATLWAEVNSNSNVDVAWIEIRPPDLTLSSTGGTVQADINLEKDFLSLNGGRWEKTYNQFTDPGMYEVFYFVKDNREIWKGMVSPMKRTVVYKQKPLADQTPPGAFSLLSPADGAETKTILAFDWQDSADDDGPVTYSFYIATDEQFTNIVHRQHGLTNSWAVVDASAKLVNNTQYYWWKVEAVDVHGSTRRSNEVWKFETKNPNVLPGFITGMVFDSLVRSPIEGAALSVISGENELASASSLPNGCYLVTVPAGTVDLSVVKAGYHRLPSTVTSVHVPEGEVVEVHVTMLPDNATEDTTAPVTTASPA
ncbi:MAG: DUF1566 domain-containing protein, partial [Proteobacteria bacterium]|nr:DUF1566 domain-containing protein [Pseudomonadota bacterium]